MIRHAAALLLGLALCACTGTATTTPSPSAAGTASSRATGTGTVDFTRLTVATPAQRTEAAIEMAFDAGEAERMAGGVPPIDFATQALLCLSLGERPTGGWSVTVQSMRVDAGELHIRAREVRPRAGDGVTQAFTYPADCVVLDRTRLPVGELAVRADDTISDEFIVAAVIQVPSR